MEKSFVDLISDFKNEKHNLLFFKDKVLFQFAASEQPESSRIACTAELFVRWFLSRDHDLATEIDQLLPDGERENFQRLLNENFLKNPSREALMQELWRSANPFSQKCLPAIRQRLLTLCCETDGFIPVYMDDQAYFIPFHLSDGAAEIRDTSGRIIENWHESYLKLAADNGQYTCIVHCCQQTLPSLTGSSLMLPLQLALWRKQGKIRYNHLRLLATGSLENNRLKAVETAEKSAGIANCFPNSYFIFPESTGYCADMPWEVPLAVGMTKTELLAKLPEIIESKGLFVPTLNDALRRLPELIELRDAIHNKWEIFYRQIDLYSRNFNRSEPEYFMLFMMLKSSILCHLGKTDDALKINRKAQKFAVDYNLEKSLRRMEIEELVELQDKELFFEISRLAEPLREKIETLADPDLLMRYYGTMGQAHCYGVLSAIDGFDREYALTCFDKAVTFAGKIGSAGDIAQDLNYRYLWYAIFEPETEDAAEAFEEAKNHIDCNLQDNGNIQRKNRYFLYRYKAFALYRYLLAHKKNITENFEDFLLPDDAFFWIKATVNKYIGALYAASGNLEKAEELFDCAIGNLSRSDPVIKFIRMTALAEAYRSTGKDKYLHPAVQTAEELQPLYPSTEKWLNFLNGKEDFPGLNYWY